MLNASKLQGRGDYKNVIELSLNALELNPKSLLAFTMLADDYPRLGKYDEAEELLAKALKIYPKDCQLNYHMGVVMIKNEEPIQKALPFLENYLKFKPNKNGKFPWYMNLFSTLSQKKIDWQKFGKELNEYEDSKTQWVKKIIEENKKS